MGDIVPDSVNGEVRPSSGDIAAAAAPKRSRTTLAVLEGWDHEDAHQPLRYGDSISLVPEKFNAVLAFAGADTGRAWVQLLHEDVCVPPNMSDCQWVIMPAHNFQESKKAHKSLKRLELLEGRKIEKLPGLPPLGADLKKAAHNHVRAQKMSSSSAQAVENLMVAMLKAHEERETNVAEDQRQWGSFVRFGANVMLIQSETKRVLTVTKKRAPDGKAKIVEVMSDGNLNSIFIVKPEGMVISSGDLLTFKLRKGIASVQYSLSLSVSDGADMHLKRQEVLDAMKLQHPFIVGGDQLVARSDSDSTVFRALLFRSCDHSGSGHTRDHAGSHRKGHQDVLLGGDVVAFYNKHYSAYLQYDAQVNGDEPVFYYSHRVNHNARQKCGWMWTVESVALNNAAQPVTSREDDLFRLKHVVTNKYLRQTDGGGLVMVSDYRQAGVHGPETTLSNPTIFRFKPFARVQAAESSQDAFKAVKASELVFVVSQRAGDDDLLYLTHEAREAGRSSEASIRGVEAPGVVHMSQLAFAPAADALMMMPIRKGYLEDVRRVHNLVLSLHQFERELQRLPDVGGGGGEEKEERNGAMAKAGQEGVLALVVEWYDSVLQALRVLVLNCSVGSDTDPMSRDGIPNRRMQKVLRELGVLGLCLRLVQLPFLKGLDISSLEKPPSNSKSQHHHEHPGQGLAKMVELLDLVYRLLKQMVKGDVRNSEMLFLYLNEMRAQLGKGLLVTPTLREMFAGKLHLLKQIKEDFVLDFVGLLRKSREPQYIDFLMSICMHGYNTPITANQHIVTKMLLDDADNATLLPAILLERRAGGTGIRLCMRLMADDEWMDLSTFKKTITWKGVVQDYAGYILNSALRGLTPAEKLFRYNIRCINLFGKLAAGRNQQALAAMLRREEFSYSNLMSIIEERTLPYLLRARFLSLMLSLYVDRDPQVREPLVLFTRKWRKLPLTEVRDPNLLPATGRRLTRQQSMLDDKSVQAAQGKSVPVCSTGFDELKRYLLGQLKSLAGCTADESGKPSLLGQGDLRPSFGQLELLKACLNVTAQLVAFGFFQGSERRNGGQASEDLKSIFGSVWKMLEVGEGDDERNTVESRLHNEVRVQSLTLLKSLFEIRLNVRISMVVAEWETLSELDRDEGLARLSPSLKGLQQKLFGSNHVCPESLSSDIYWPLKWVNCQGGDVMIARLLSLCKLNHLEIRENAWRLLIWHCSQKVALLTALEHVQLLSSPATVQAFAQAHTSVTRITGLTKFLHETMSIEPENVQRAATELIEVLESLSLYLTLDRNRSQEDVRQAQKIFLNIKVHDPVLQVLRVHLNRDCSRRDKKEADHATNESLREVFQACYTFLKLLACRFPQGQTVLAEHVMAFAEHIGIEKLNVADTISTIFRDNMRLCSQLSAEFIAKYLDAIRMWGRRARWLRFFELYVVIDGKPLKRNQDLVLSLLLQNKFVMDLDCDYSVPGHLAASDERNGMRRWDLLCAGDHKRPVYSLVRFHCTCLDVLSSCAEGKNHDNKAQLAGLLDVRMMLQSILAVDVCPDSGERQNGADADSIRYVQRPWIRLLKEVYLTNRDESSIALVVEETRMLDLILEFAQTIEALAVRLARLDASSYAGNAELLEAVSDDFGHNIGTHFKCVEQMIAASMALFARDSVIWPRLVSTDDNLRRVSSVQSASPVLPCADKTSYLGAAETLLASMEHLYQVVTGGHVETTTTPPGAFLAEFPDTNSGSGVCRREPELVSSEPELVSANYAAANRMNRVHPDPGDEAGTTLADSNGSSLNGEDEDTEASDVHDGNAAKRRVAKAERRGHFRYEHMEAAIEGLLACCCSHKIANTRSLCKVVRTSRARMKDDSGFEVSMCSKNEAECFNNGWHPFCQQLAHELCEGESKDVQHQVRAQGGVVERIKMIGIKDVALVLGTQAHDGLQSLQMLMRTLRDGCDDGLMLTGLKIIRACLYVSPAKQPSSEKAKLREYNQFLSNHSATVAEVPDPRLQTRIAQLGGVDAVVECFRSSNMEVVLAALRLANAMMNPQVQGMFAEALQPAAAEPFFLKLQSLFSEGKMAVKEARRKLKQEAAEKSWSQERGQVQSQVQSLQSVRGLMSKRPTESVKTALRQWRERTQTKARLRVHALEHMLEALTLMGNLCGNACRALQNILREQKDNNRSVNFFAEASEYLLHVEPDLKEAIEHGQQDTVLVIERVFFMLVKGMEGPNSENQTIVANLGIFDLCDRILARINFNNVVYDEYFGERQRSSQQRMERETSKNLARNRVKIAITLCLRAFLEGVSERDAIHMLEQVDWFVIGNEMVSCFEIYEKDPSIDNKAKYLAEGMNYYLLMCHISKYDTSHQVIRPRLAAIQQLNPRCLEFFDRRKGYIEIVRNGALERVFFQVPEKCLSADGGLSENEVRKMYEGISAEDSCDEKNRQWVLNMNRIVRAHKFQDSILRTRLAFTVSHWDLISRVNFLWIFGMHVLMVLGGYMPNPILAWDRGMHDEYAARLAAHASASQSASSLGSEEGDSELDPHNWTSADRFFFDEASPVVKETVRIMSYLNLMSCCLRFFAFAWSRLPMILEIALENSVHADGVGARDRQGPPVLAQPRSQERQDSICTYDSIFVAEAAAPTAEPALQQAREGAGHDLAETMQAKRYLWRRKVKAMIRSPEAVGEVLHILCPVFAVALEQPLLTLYALFEIATWEGSRMITDVIILNSGKLLRALILGILFIYTWMIVGIWFFRPILEHDVCSNMFQCFWAYFGKAIRDNGVYEVLEPPNYPHNIADALTGSDLFLYRFVFDLSFQIVFIYILLAMITGIVIDAFSEMQARKMADEENLKNWCFVCNITRSEVNQHGIGWDRHIKHEHDPQAYLFYLFALGRKGPEAMTEQELYVHERIRSIGWLPREQTFTLKRREELL